MSFSSFSIPPLLLMSALFGCFRAPSTVPVNLDYAETSRGYLNSGSYQAGSLFRWHKGQEADDLGYLVYIGDLEGFEEPLERDVTEKDTAFYSRGAKVHLDPKLKIPVNVDLDAEIAKRSVFYLTNFQRQKSAGYLTRTTDHIKYSNEGPDGQRILKTPEELENLLLEWNYWEAVKDPNQFYILVTDVTYGDSLSLVVDKKVVNDLTVEVPSVGGKIRFDLVGKDLRELKGDFKELLFRVDVLDPCLKENDDNGFNPSFDVVTGNMSPDVPELLRNIDNANIKRREAQLGPSRICKRYQS